jgi:hypothetical protein
VLVRRSDVRVDDVRVTVSDGKVLRVGVLDQKAQERGVGAAAAVDVPVRGVLTAGVVEDGGAAFALVWMVKGLRLLGPGEGDLDGDLEDCGCGCGISF